MPRATRIVAIGGALAFAASILFGALAYGVTFGQDTLTSRLTSEALRSVGIDVAMFTVFALHHSIFARTNLKRRLRLRVGTDIERSIYVWIDSILFFLMFLFWQPLP